MLLNEAKPARQPLFAVFFCGRACWARMRLVAAPTKCRSAAFHSLPHIHGCVLYILAPGVYCLVLLSAIFGSVFGLTVFCGDVCQSRW